MEIFNQLLGWLGKHPNWYYAAVGFAVGLVTPMALRILFFLLRKLGFGLSLFNFVPGFLLRKFYSKKGMVREVEIAIDSRGESLVFDLGRRPCCRLWLKITNNLPFDIEFEQLNAKVYFDTLRINVALDEDDSLKIRKYSSADEILLRGELSNEQVVVCSKKMDKYLPVEINARIQTRFNYIDKNSGHLANYHVRNKGARMW